MWKKTFTKHYTNVTKEAVWKAWADVNHWGHWDEELEYCQMNDGDAFADGTVFIMKPVSGPKIKIILYDVVPMQCFSDYCRFPGAKMSDVHTIETVGDGVQISNTTTMTGLVGKSVAKGIAEQTDNLVEYARAHYE